MNAMSLRAVLTVATVVAFAWPSGLADRFDRLDRRNPTLCDSHKVPHCPTIRVAAGLRLCASLRPSQTGHVAENPHPLLGTRSADLVVRGDLREPVPSLQSSSVRLQI